MERVSEIKTVLVAPTTTLNSGGTANISGVDSTIDTLGYDFLQVVVLTGTIASGGEVSVFKLQSSDTDGSYVDYTGATVGADAAGDTDDDGRLVINVDLRGKERYWQAVVSCDEAANTPVTVIANLGKADTSPAADSDLIAVAYA